MTRIALLAALLATPARADVPVAPPPRAVAPDGSRDPVPAPATPAETVVRIIRNARAASDKLAKTDTGTATRTVQSTILKDIDSLLAQNGSPPPAGGDSGDKSDPKHPDLSQDAKKNGGDPSGAKGDKPPPKGGPQPGGGTPMPPGDANQQATGGRRPRMGGSDPKPKDARPDPAGGKKPDPMAKNPPPPGGTDLMPPAGPKPPTAPVAGMAAGTPTGKAPPTRSVPLDEDVAKDVWGHLPDQLRQQVTQYYKEQFMPRYADLLKQYYSSLATTPPRPGGGRK